MTYRVRDYTDLDEASWLRCRVLSFLGSAYFDDVRTERTAFDGEALRFVAVHQRPDGVTTPGADEVVGILDVELWEEDGRPVATIDSVATHPDHQHAGIATTLLDTALRRVHGHGLAWLDAWTREDPAANAWYLDRGFALDQTYLHLYKDDAAGDSDEGFSSPHGLATPVKAFLHGPDEDPEVWRARFARVHQCRRYVRLL